MIKVAIESVIVFCAVVMLFASIQDFIAYAVYKFQIDMWKVWACAFLWAAFYFVYNF